MVQNFGATAAISLPVQIPERFAKFRGVAKIPKFLAINV